MKDPYKLKQDHNFHEARMQAQKEAMIQASPMQKGIYAPFLKAAPNFEMTECNYDNSYSR